MICSAYIRESPGPLAWPEAAVKRLLCDGLGACLEVAAVVPLSELVLSAASLSCQLFQ